MMSKTLLLAICLAAMETVLAQDTIMYANGQRIIGAVEEIQRESVRYRTRSAGNEVVITVEKIDLEWVHLAGGQQFQYGPGGWNDPVAQAFMQRKNVVGLDLFAPALDHLTLSYERLLNARNSLVVRIGKIGVWNREKPGQDLVNDGFLLKAGPKLMLTKSLRRAPGLYANHPLAGWYLRPELIFSYWTNTEYPTYFGPIYPQSEERAFKEFHSSAAVNLAFGGQFFLGDRFCLDLYAGLGYGVAWRNGVTQPEDRRYSQRENYTFSHAFFGGSSPLCSSGGALIGYAF